MKLGLISSHRWGVLAGVALVAVVPVFIGCADGAGDEPLGDTLESAPGSGIVPGTTLPASSSDAAPPSKDGGRDGSSDVEAGSSCAPSSTCSAPVDLGSLAGDVGSEASNQTGSGSRWFKVLVREDSTSSASIKLRGQLTSPAGSNYDLFFYTGLYSTTSTECSNVRASSTSTGAPDIARIDLEDYTGIDDEQLVTVEVRHVSGPCDATATWTLTLTGNAL